MCFMGLMGWLTRGRGSIEGTPKKGGDSEGQEVLSFIKRRVGHARATKPQAKTMLKNSARE